MRSFCGRAIPYSGRKAGLATPRKFNGDGSCNRRSQIYNRKFSGGVLAQLVERLNGIEEVRGSNPLGSSLRSAKEHRLPSLCAQRGLKPAVIEATKLSTVHKSFDRSQPEPGSERAADKAAQSVHK
jgi:hypothetical protein